MTNPVSVEMQELEQQTFLSFGSYLRTHVLGNVKNRTRVPETWDDYDWNVCALGLEGVTVMVDSDADGVFESSLNSDGELTAHEFESDVHQSIDLNGDGEVNIIDVSIAAMAFGSNPLDPNWNIIVDLNNDQIINILDISTVAMKFGKTV